MAAKRAEETARCKRIIRGVAEPVRKQVSHSNSRKRLRSGLWRSEMRVAPHKAAML